jgi:hypothetical protein
MATTFYQTSPAYGSPAAWCESNHAIGHVIHLHQTKLKRALGLAGSIRQSMEKLFPLMDELCLLTCRLCPNPCCLVATVWIDFRDLLFLHLSELPIPPAQLISNLNEDCRFYGHRGCRLPRLLRPWACTIYLCGTQVPNLRRKPQAIQKAYDRNIAAIKAQRFEMEAEFIKVIT